MLISGILRRIAKARLVAGYYHLVANEPPPHIKHLYECKSISQFEHDLEFLVRRYIPIDIGQLAANIKFDQPIPEKSLLISFDDGFREIAEIIAPLLLKKGISAVFFVNSAFIDNKAMSYDHKKSLIIHKLMQSSKAQITHVRELLGNNSEPTFDWQLRVRGLKYNEYALIEHLGHDLDIDFNSYLHEQRPYLSQDQIKSLLSDGFSVGSHSIDHPLYADIPLEEQLRQTADSLLVLKTLFGIKVGLFAFPHSDAGVSARFFDEIAKRHLTDLTFGTGGILDDSMNTHIQRMSFERPVKDVEQLISRQLARRIYRRIGGTAVINHPPCNTE